jgi:tripartite-type tricarboxylate transporter receptor subunit TctC
MRLTARVIAVLSLPILMLGLALPASSQSGDRRILHIIVPFAAGGVQDILARSIADDLGKALGQTVIVENKPGAGGTVGTALVAKAAADGQTVVMAAASHLIAPYLYSKLAYDPLKDFVPAAYIGTASYILMIPESVPANSAAEFIRHAKSNPGKLNYASAGNGTLPHVSMELLLRRTGIEVAHIPYRGAAPAMTDLIAGQVQLKMDTYATANQLVADSKLRALAYASRARSPLMPNVPTVAEMGLPGYEGILWIGMMAPAGTPRPVIDKLAVAAQRATHAPDLAERLKRDGVDPAGRTPEAFGALIVREIREWRNLAQSSKITLD